MPDVQPSVLNKVLNLFQVRKNLFPNFNSDLDLQPAGINPRGDQIVSLGLPLLAEVVRTGNSWQALTSSATAPITGLPGETVSHFHLYNGEPQGGKSYIIDSAGTILAVTAGAVINLGLFGGVSPQQASIPASLVTAGCRSMSGKTRYDGRGGIKEGGGTGLVTGLLTPLGSVVRFNETANAGLWVDFPDLWGRFVVPPNCMFSLISVCDAAGTATCKPYMRWHEVQL